MNFDLKLILRVFYAPNSTFAKVRDNDEKYFAQSVGILVFSTVLLGLMFLPVYLLLLPELEQIAIEEELVKEGLSEIPELEELTNPGTITTNLIMSLMSEIIFIAVLFLIGKKLSGNTNWKKVFSVISHTYVITIPFAISAIILMYFFTFTILDARVQGESLQSSIQYVMSFVVENLAALLSAVAVYIIWALIVTIKAIKVVNNYSTLKAIGVFILVIIVSAVVQMPIGFIVG